MCADCMPGYSRDGRGKCKKCDESAKVAVPILAIFALIACLVFLVWSTVIKRGGAFKASDGAKKSFISYLQLASLCATMTIPWPVNYIGMFRAQALVSSVGEEFIDIRCMMESPIPIAQVEYLKALAYAILPWVLVSISVVIWGTCGKRFVDKKRVRPMMTGTIGLLLYLVYPSVSASVLSLWKCEEVEGLSSPIFVVDPETFCDDALHMVWINALGIPSVLVYLLGLPLLAVILLYKFRNKLDEVNTRIRFGLLYDGYNRENYMHEIFVVARKLSIIVIGIFNKNLQVQLALGAVTLFLTHTVLVKPFQTQNLFSLEIVLLTCSFFTLWVGGIFQDFPQGCQSSSSNAPNLVCQVAEIAVLVFNIFSMVLGFSVYVWLAWLEKRSQLSGRMKSVCAALSGLCIFRPCCKKGIGIWLRASQVDFVKNPINEGVELGEIDPTLSERGKEIVAKLKAMVRKVQKDAEKDQETIATLQNDKAQDQETIAALQQELLEYRNEQLYSSEDQSRATEWEVHLDGESGDFYYYNNISDETSWDRPPGVDPWYFHEKENQLSR